MISIARHMDEYDIAQEIRLERKVHKGSFLLLEGDTDIKRFSRFIDEAKCSIVNCYGRRRAIAATEMLSRSTSMATLPRYFASVPRSPRPPKSHLNSKSLVHPQGSMILINSRTDTIFIVRWAHPLETTLALVATCIRGAVRSKCICASLLTKTTFRRLSIYRAICEWVRMNHPFHILQAGLAL